MIKKIIILTIVSIFIYIFFNIFYEMKMNFLFKKTNYSKITFSEIFKWKSAKRR